MHLKMHTQKVSSEPKVYTNVKGCPSYTSKYESIVKDKAVLKLGSQIAARLPRERWTGLHSLHSLHRA